MEIREYQSEWLNFHKKNYFVNSVLQAPTGVGKSIGIINLVNLAVKLGHKVLIITPRKELCDNLSSRLPNSGVSYTGSKPLSHQELATLKILIVTYKSAAKFASLFQPDIIVSDEAHISVCQTWHNAIQQC